MQQHSLWAAQISRRTGYQAPLSVENTRKIDNILLHRIWGPLLFLAVVIGVFEVVFAIGQPLSDGFGDILARAADLIRPFLPPAGYNPCCSMARGKASRPSSSFCRRSCCCFSLLDSGRLRLPGPRRADRRPRHAHHRPQRQSLHPAALGLCCAVPAIMATRTIENRRDRLATILVTPFMTCLGAPARFTCC